MRTLSPIFLFVIVLLVGCGRKGATFLIEPGDDLQKRAQTVFIQAKAGDIIEFSEGQFVFYKTLSLDVENVTVRGRGMGKTVLNFEKQQTGSGGEGLLVTKGRFTIEDLAIEDTRGDAIKVEDVKGIAFRRVRVEWTRDSDPTNGGYGLYPVKSDDVLIEDCVAIGASDAGIYVGQCRNVIVRNNIARKNVAGIEIENTVGADVYGNLAEDNTGGMLVFTLPNLPRNEGRQCRVFDNVIKNNNRSNFAPIGTAVSGIPTGSGLIIMAFDEVEVFANQLSDNDTCNLSVTSFLSSDSNRKIKDPTYDSYCESIYIHDNQFSGGGTNPVGLIGGFIRAQFPSGGPDIVYDGMVDPGKLVDGVLPRELGLFIENNFDATFANLDWIQVMQNKTPTVSTDLSPHRGSLPALPEIRISWQR